MFEFLFFLNRTQSFKAYTESGFGAVYTVPVFPNMNAIVDLSFNNAKFKSIASRSQRFSVFLFSGLKNGNNQIFVVATVQFVSILSDWVHFYVNLNLHCKKDKISTFPSTAIL